jgi:SAM-dependent methyltransferase
MMLAHLFFLLAASTNHNNIASLTDEEPSRWRRRTAKRRQRVDELLDSIESGGLQLPEKLTRRGVFSVPTLQIPSQSRINWDDIDPMLDPMQGGKIRISERGLRKRAQVDAFNYVLSSLVDAKLQYKKNQCSGITIIDAGCGAGNLAIAISGLLSPKRDRVRILAVDINEQALHRLEERTKCLHSRNAQLETCCADLANYVLISSRIPPDQSVIVMSLHACGAASDMAMNLAFRCNNAPFVICPCCTAKSLIKRSDVDPVASFQRSGASTDILYPRSSWLRSKLQLSELSSSVEEQYAILAKVADVGLGPQTPAQQRKSQNRAKKVVELDRLLSASENRDYAVCLLRLPDHDPLVYGKGDLLLGAHNGSVEAGVMRAIFDSGCQ